MKLSKIYANKSRSRMMNLREKLAISKGNKTVSEYFQLLRSMADDLALTNKPVNEEELVIHALNGIGSYFREIAIGVWARESNISFEELLDKFLDYERFLKKQDMLNESIIPSANFAAKGKPMNQSTTHVNKHNNTQGNQRHSNVVCQFYEKAGHLAKLCCKIKNNKKPSPSANYSASKDSTWLMDYGSTHHVTSDLNKLKFYKEYEGTNSLTIGNGSSLSISHIGSSLVSSSNNKFHLTDGLCVPKANRNLIYDSKFCDTNSIFIEFFPLCFHVKDLHSRKLLACEKISDGIYLQVVNPKPFNKVRSSSHGLYEN